MSSILQRRVSYVFFTLCFITTIMFFASHEENDYTHVSEDKIQSELFKAISPHLVKKSNKECNYDKILASTDWEMAEVYNFSATGIENGSYVPEQCNSLFSVAIIVTYRNRKRQLRVFMTYMHNFLRKQNIHYKTYLTEQVDKKPWNKGLLYNIGALQAIHDKFPCLILHDVDMLPLDARNLYVCTNQPRHMSACVDKFEFILPYKELVGGVLAIKSDQFTAVNGFSNRFHDWGGEDDDFAARMATHGLSVLRFPRSMSRYAMLQHRPQNVNRERYRILKENRQPYLSREGLRTMRYTNKTIEHLPLYTRIQVRT